MKLHSRFTLSAFPVSGGQTECFGVAVTGPGLSSINRTCGPSTALQVGFVTEGQSLSLEVPSGKDRIVSVYMYLLPSGQTQCPSWNISLEDSYGTVYKSMYKVGEARNVSTESDASVSITIAAPTSLDDHVVSALGQSTACAPAVSSYLLSNGTLVDKNYNPIINDPDEANVQSVMGTSFNSTAAAQFLQLTTAWQLATGIVIPAYVKSIAIHPTNSSNLLAFTEDGTLLDVVKSSGASTIYSACAFENCNVPVWMKSIAVGPGLKLYGLDHGGNLYLITSSGPLSTSMIVPPYVEQVIF